MKKRIFLLLVGGLGTTVAGALALVPATPFAPAGAGPTVTRLLTLPTAEGLDVGVFADVTVAEGRPQQITMTGPAPLLDQLRAEVVDGVLCFRRPGTVGGWLRKLQSPERLKISVVVPVLRQLKLTGAGSLTGLTPLTAPALAVELAGAGRATLRVANSESTHLTISGAGEVILSGTTPSQDVRLSGAGSYHGYGLRSADAVIRLTGIGTAELTATRSLSAEVSGVGRVHYRGRPATVTGRVSGVSILTASE